MQMIFCDFPDSTGDSRVTFIDSEGNVKFHDLLVAFSKPLFFYSVLDFFVHYLARTDMTLFILHTECFNKHGFLFVEEKNVDYIKKVLHDVSYSKNNVNVSSNNLFPTGKKFNSTEKKNSLSVEFCYKQHYRNFMDFLKAQGKVTPES